LPHQISQSTYSISDGQQLVECSRGCNKTVKVECYCWYLHFQYQ